MSLRIKPYLFAIIFFQLFYASAQTTSLVFIDSKAGLTYKPDAVGSVIPDYSGVGYKNSEASLPNVPVVKVISSVAGDNYEHIQSAINEVAAMPLQKNGIRGSILFKAGTYNISKAILINASGIVLRGEGDGTEFVATGTIQYDLIRISGGLVSTHKTTRKQIVDAFLPAGIKKITVDNGHSFKAGDWVHVTREPNAAWISLLGADKLSGMGTDKADWTPEGFKVDYERQVLKVEGNVLTIDAPVMDIIDPIYAKGFVTKITSTRIQHCGIENIKMTSAYTTTWPSSLRGVAHDEAHGWNAIMLFNARDCWVKNVHAYYFGYSCVNIGKAASFITVDSCTMYDPISLLEGGRRYSFNVDGQRSLVKNCITREGRHDYVNGARVAGPNVFYNCKALNARSVTGPHHRWATGILYDNIWSENEINAEDRVISGTGHGWTGAQIMFWNCTAKKMVVQDPPSHHTNWAIGCVAEISGKGSFSSRTIGVVESQHKSIEAIPSLFIVQLRERLKRKGL